MECELCHRDSLKFYCEACLDTRLADHLSRKTHLAQQLNAVTNRSLALLSPPPPSTALGVLEERQLKASKFTLGTRLRDLRVASAEGKEALEEGKKRVEERRKNVKERKERLSKARELHSPTPVATKAVTEEEELYRKHSRLFRDKAKTDLATVFSILPSSPFSSSPFTTPSDSTGEPVASISTLLSFPIPSPSHLTSEPPPLTPQQLSFVLTQLLHLLRLVAMYNQVILPFELDARAYAGVVGCSGLFPSAAWASALKIPTTKSAFPVDTYASLTSSGSSGGKEKKEKEKVVAPPSSITHVSPKASNTTTATKSAPSPPIRSPSSSTISTSSSKPHKTSSKEKASKPIPSALRHGVVALSYNYAYLVWYLGYLDEVTVQDVDALARNVEWIVFGIEEEFREDHSNNAPTSSSFRKPLKKRRDFPAEIFPIAFDVVYEHYVGSRTSHVAASTLLGNSAEMTAHGRELSALDDEEEGWDLV